ncbi:MULTISPECIES: dTDP-4-dehydrorhamnose 3,5-epimerase [Pantoea]|uniref:dTDP-4-dehydrorhamnose 3,5-epimerase n=1 Tax=Pantoea TaxID=53335 RepID=UPI000A246F85|nr:MULTISPECIES: dTDP-4-dehydrorhamnose 3,5-epimerase [Pantoea]ORM77334.1 dTDP-4-dehydrorhamnose 3,5-epimerase [Pantoea eucrina]
MNIIETDIPGLLILEPKVYGDERGFFLESYNSKDFNEAVGEDIVFLQDNHSKSKKGVLRGLHFQKKPAAQGKLVRCINGEVYDVVVDLRLKSPTFKQWFGVYLSSTNMKQLWIPEGFAHGFIVKSETAEFVYKTTNYYSPENDRCLKWNDECIGIEWPLGAEFFLSEKDKNGLSFEELEKDFFI